MNIGELLIDVVVNPFKATIASISGLAVSAVPTVSTTIQKTSMTEFDIAFQHTAWFLTSVVALTAIVTFIQKQIDRYKQRRLW